MPTPNGVPAVASPGGGRGVPVVPAIVILGADTVLAARPATAVQLANACLAAGYSAAVPASWGDELIASACLEALATRGDEATVVCSCPRVAERLRRVPSVRSSLLMFVAPPVAAARYLRARAGAAGLTITYVGDCPGAADPAIDRYATPAALMRSLARRGIVPSEQATTIDPRVERDARRFYSLAGGVPAPNWVYAEGRGAGVVQPESADYLAEIAHHVTARDRAVIDIAPRLGCACSGAVAGEAWAGARQVVTESEPERAVHEVLDHDVIVDVSGAIEPWVGSVSDGTPTLATTLQGLAAQYDPERKAPVIRRAPPSPVPFPVPTARAARRSGRQPAVPAPPPPSPRAPEPFTAGPPRNAPSFVPAPRVPEPLTGGPPHAFDPFTPVPPAAINPFAPSRPAAAKSVPPAPSSNPFAATPPRRAAEPKTPVMSPKAPPDRVLPSRSVEPITAATFAALRPNQTAPQATGGIGPITAAGIDVTVPGAPSADGWDGTNRRRWDGVERRKGWANGQPPHPEPTTNPLPVEPRTAPMRQPQGRMGAGVDRRSILGLAVACSAIVASATSIVTVRMLTRGHPAVAAPSVTTVPLAPKPIVRDSAPPPPPPPPVDTAT
ncbi:MAG TPA: hypothetical protein VNW46_16805, partial [Gemmatimonadaceae bacterium]|nr:hypothetical protein [Gemmatimonadaceae bacterium]